MNFLSQLLSVVFVLTLALGAHGQEESFSSLSSVSTENSLTAPSNWRVSYFNLTSAGVKEVNEGASTLSMYNYFSLNYRISRDEKFSLRPAFVINTTGFDRNGENQPMGVKAGDLYLNYSHTSLALLPGEWGLEGDFRLYLPTSESTQNKKTITYLHSWLRAEKRLGAGWKATYNFRPSFFIQSQKAYRSERETVNADGSKQLRIEARRNMLSELEQYLTVSRYMKPWFQPQLELGTVTEWYHTSNQTNRGDSVKNYLSIAPGTQITVNRQLRFIFAIDNQIEITDSKSAYTSGDSTLTWKSRNGKSIEFFRPEQTQYLLLTFLSI
ncbi:MAG: hypothetical protein LW875_07580 [Proteobacteria bacterium]|jgi:hypothetical protein|nr:hypothetical protein [Pseudomonadota bacterium]